MASTRRLAAILAADVGGYSRLEALMRAFLVRLHQARITRDIGGKDRGKTAG